MRWKVYNPSENPRLVWHRWFAWHPVKINDKETVWLEFVLRKQVHQPYWTRFDMIMNKIFFATEYEYKSTIFDIIKDGHEKS